MKLKKGGYHRDIKECTNSPALSDKTTGKPDHTTTKFIRDEVNLEKKQSYQGNDGI